MTPISEFDLQQMQQRTNTCFDSRAIQRFWSKVDKDGPIIRADLGRCWNWTGTITTYGYGELEISDFKWRAHRISMILHFRDFKHRELGLHRCDNRRCVNPGHLFYGTDKDNADDRDSKGRTGRSCGEKNGSKTKPESILRGSARPTSKLTEEKVLEIRQIGRTLPQSELASIFGVHQSDISLVINRKIWTHV